MPPLSPSKKQALKRKLIHDLQTFLWQFEQGGYSREAMTAILEKFAAVLESDSQQLDEGIGQHVQQMLGDCRSYAEGKGDSLSIVKDLDQLRRDLE
ncbi:MAG: hypothetical protein AAF443_02490 [Chlamydiota bacterium]